jgi:hypothetical protein
MSSAITIGVVSAAVSAYGAYQGQQNAQKSQDLVNTVAGKQNFYNTQLQTLMKQPEEFFNNPVYTAARDQGLQATERQMAAGGFNGSGNMMQELMKYGQGFGQQQLLEQEKLLAPLTGAGQNIFDGQNVANNQQQAAFKEMSSSMAAFGALSKQYSDKFSTTKTATANPAPSAANGDFAGSQNLGISNQTLKTPPTWQPGY